MKLKILFSLFIVTHITAQNIPIGSIDFSEDRGRNKQLLDNTYPLLSYSLRPLSQSLVNDTLKNQNKEKFKIQFLPILQKMQYNTFAPSGWNDGAMIPTKGFQTLLSAGFFAQYDFLSIQLKPEYVYAANPDFETFPLTESNLARTNHIYYLNHIDTPERFGDKPYRKMFWGQSNISANYKSMSIGVSTENLWWGPGQRNSLTMSNNSPGFLHFTLNTRKPIKTFIGSFEGQLISGKLETSGLDVSEDQYIIDKVNYKLPKEQQWRYLSGITINYQPKWVPGLFIGLNRIFQVYNTDLGNSFSDYFPVVTPFQKKDLVNEDIKKRDQIASLFLRWVFKESHSEIYFENMWNDHSQDFLYLFDSPSQSSAYLLGFSKIFILNSNKENYLKFNFEHTDIGVTSALVGKNWGSSYIHGIIRQGYTNQSQMLGAGIGTGSNSQTFDFSIWNKDSVWGFQLERFAHNLDFYYIAYTENNHKWVDMNLNTYAYRRFGNLSVQTKLNTSWMRSYQWQNGNDPLNFQIQVTLQYHL
jgi:hypothetical protein